VNGKRCRLPRSFATIDNVTRKLMQARKLPVTVGFFFAIGHSTVGILATAGVAATATLLSSNLERFKSIGPMVGTISVLFFAPGAVGR
jgi:nickel/cobalt transporter (NiCoT) family protein